MYKLAETRDISIGHKLVVVLPDGREIAIFNLEGKYYALDNACPHKGAPLAEGDIDNTHVICPWHGWQFDIKTGTCLNVPGEDAISIQLEILEGVIYFKDSIACNKKLNEGM